MSEDRGVWHSKTGVKGQDRSSASPRLNTGAQDKKASQSSTKGGAGRGQGTGKDRANIWQGPEAARQPEPSPASVAEEHIPMNNYNAREVEAAMKSPVEPRPLVYKAAEKIPSGGRFGAAPWGSKPGCMASGKDFWVDLRKQYTALQRSGGTREGG